MSHEVIYRPERPIGPKGKPLGPDASDNLMFYYRVMLRSEVVVAYNPFYFITTNEIVADLLELMKTESWQVRFVQFEDFVIWNHDRVLAVVHSLKDFEADPVENRVVLFNEDGNRLYDHPLWSGWPTRDEWIAKGRGPLDWLSPTEHPERDYYPPTGTD